MSSDKNKTPASSPKVSKAVKLDVPSTPPTSRGRKRLSNYLSTPEQQSDSLPLSPSIKRSNSGSFRSPEHRTNTSDIVSPYSAYNLLKTPRDADEDSDEKATPRRAKLMKTPQYFSVGKRLFDEETSPSRKDLGEISSQLKNKLSSAFDTLQQKGKSDMSPVKMEHAESTGPKDSPTRPHTLPRNTSNLNLITLEHSPSLSSPATFCGFAKPEVQTSPVLNQEYPSFNIPSPDEESSAQNALLAAFVRVKGRKMSHSGERRKSSVGQTLSEGFLPSPPARRSHNCGKPPKLAPLQTTAGKERSGKSEQDAIYSLMSLSAAPKNNSESPQGLAHQNTSSPSSRSSSIVMTALPPISGLSSRDDDATDIEDATASEDEPSDE